MADVNPAMPAIGELVATAEPKVLTALQTLVSTINNLETANLADGAITADKLAGALAALEGISQAGAVRRGAFTAGTETFTPGSSYAWATTEDRVQNVILPTNGLLAVAYQATWAESVSGAARAAIHMDDLQLKGNGGSSVPIVQEADHGNTATQDQPLHSCAGGLRGNSPTASWSNVGTGQIIGEIQSGSTFQYPAGPCFIFADAGTYDVGVKFKASSGTVTVKNRKLWVWTMGF